MPTPISGVYFIVKSLKKSSSCPKNNRGVTHQTDEKHIYNMSKYFVGVVNKAFNCYNNRFVAASSKTAALCVGDFEEDATSYH